MPDNSFGRRKFLAGGGFLAAGAALTSFPARASERSQGPDAPGSPGNADPTARRMPLSFNSDGRFRIVQFNDTQDDHRTDRRTIELMGRVLDEEQPDFALINGDVITGGPRTNQEVYQAINNVVLPMESRGIPWAVTFGNHDEDSTEQAGTSVFEPQMVEFVRQYERNLNPTDEDGLYGSSNGQLLVSNSQGNDAAFAIWLLDSGRYAPDALAGQSTDPLPSYDWIRPEQISWYTELSRDTEQRFGKKVPGLMYFHIPTFEHRDMWFGGPYEMDEASHAEAAERHGIVGVKNEGVYVGAFNSGIYAAALGRGDVLGIYCGHDHINTYTGNYYGIELGYGPGTGFGPYGLNDGTWDQHTLRGARIFDLNENSERIYESTRVVFAEDLGIDMNPDQQPLDQPEPFPEYVTAPGAPDGGGEDQPGASSGLRNGLSSSLSGVRS